MKTIYFSVLLALTVSSVFSQTKSVFASHKNVSPTLFNEDKVNTLTYSSLEMLGKTSWNDYPDAASINLLPKNFNWHKDARKIESYKYWYRNSLKQDLCGRDLPADVHAEVIQNTYSRSLLER